MVLLHALAAKPKYELVVAHFDHGIRPDSGEDRLLVEKTSENLSLPFEYKEGQLGPGASEAAARKARYDFLRSVQKKHDAYAIVTAHHQDDVLETAVINLLRGTGRKGLTSLGNRQGIERPLLNTSKQEILGYARQQRLEWREDSTNQDTDYLRNYVRHMLLPRFDDDGRRQLLGIITGLKTTNTMLDEVIAGQLARQKVFGQLDRGWFAALPHDAAREVMASWLRYRGIRDFDSKALERLVVAAKTAPPGKVFDVRRGNRLAVRQDHLALVGAER
jgi:tRNA(Ile)-lysidine synthetase-like protein